MERYQYFLRRLLLVIPTFLGITFVCFLICQMVPGGPVQQMILELRGLSTGEGGGSGVGTEQVTEEYIETLREHFGFDKPIAVRYWNWLYHQKLGLTATSYKYPNKTAWELIRTRIPISLMFGLTGFLLSYLVCIPLGIGKALRHGSAFDVSSSVIVFIGYAVPAFALGMVLKTLVCGTSEQFWDIFPHANHISADFDELGAWGKFKDVFMHMFLPVTCYVMGSFAVLTILMKNSLMEQISQDYVRTVLAKGATARRAIWGHALRNSLIPIATGFGGILTLILVGSVLIEKVFEIPGMGLLGLDAIVGRDYMVFMGILSISSILGLIGNILSDFCYVLIDPRIHFDR